MLEKTTDTSVYRLILLNRDPQFSNHHFSILDNKGDVEWVFDRVKKLCEGIRINELVEFIFFYLAL